jgi:hypothetical protein
MKTLIEAFSQNIRDAIQIGNSTTFTSPKNEIKNMLFVD